MFICRWPFHYTDVVHIYFGSCEHDPKSRKMLNRFSFVVRGRPEKQLSKVAVPGNNSDYDTYSYSSSHSGGSRSRSSSPAWSGSEGRAQVEAICARSQGKPSMQPASTAVATLILTPPPNLPPMVFACNIDRAEL